MTQAKDKIKMANPPGNNERVRIEGQVDVSNPMTEEATQATEGGQGADKKVPQPENKISSVK